MKKAPMNNIVRKIPAPLIAVALFLLSSQSTLPMPPNPFFGIDKVAHFIAYATLAFAIALLFPFSWWEKPFTTAILAISIASFYGVTDEIHQYFVPGRNASIADWVADTFGAISGTSIYYFLFAKRQRI